MICLLAASLAITGGLSDFQVMQRDAPAIVRGTASAAGRLRLSVASRGKPVLDRVLASVPAGEWSAQLSRIPAGGPYEIALSLGSDRFVAREVYVGDLWVLAGQSNMVGRARLENLEQPDERVHVLRADGTWAVAVEPLHERRENADGLPIGAGLGLPFAKEMVRRTGVPIGLLPIARGGTSLWQWDPALKDKGPESLYGAMIDRVRKAGGRVKGVLWYQGEADSVEDRAAQYAGRFRSFVAAVRSDLGDPDLPFYYAQLSRYAGEEEARRTAQAWNRIQETQRLAESTIPNVRMAAAVDLELEDRVHVNTAGLKRLGLRFANLACHDLFPNVAPCARLQPGPRFAGARWDGPRRLRLAFTGVNGSLVASGRVLGFGLYDQYGRRHHLIFRAWIPAQPGNEVVLELNHQYPFPKPTFLWYGKGLDPACNVSDEAGMALPVFGPVELADG
jgi:sialate O-acetylesterase